MTPLAEFNIHTDPLAAALIFSLTSPDPSSTLPPSPPLPSPNSSSPPQPPVSRAAFATTSPSRKPLTLTLLPLDITTRTLLHQSKFKSSTARLLAADSPSPLATWTTAFLDSTFKRSKEGTMALHDPLAVYYAMTSGQAEWQVDRERDLRIEVQGQWTRGAVISDRRGLEKRVMKRKEDRGWSGDIGRWLDVDKGNRVGVVSERRGGEEVEVEMLRLMFG